MDFLNLKLIMNTALQIIMKRTSVIVKKLAMGNTPEDYYETFVTMDPSEVYDKDAVIIIVSSVGTQSQLKSALEAGATDFIQKPINKIHILDALNKYLGR